MFTGDVGEHYPLGAFMLLGVGHGLTGIDPAWIIQPYFACCAAALALCIYALVEPLVPSPRLRALVAFLARAAGAALRLQPVGRDQGDDGGVRGRARDRAGRPAAAASPARDARDVRALLPLAVAAGALIQTLEIGAGGWAAPALADPRVRLARAGTARRARLGRASPRSAASR